jgi:transcription initiation factor TFIIB
MHCFATDRGKMPDLPDLKKLLREDRQVCPICGKRDSIIFDENGKAVCKKDGAEIPGMGREYYRGPPKVRDSNTGNLETKGGSPESLVSYDMGLSTRIGKNNVDAHGSYITGQMKSDIERLRTWDSRSKTHGSADRNRKEAFDEMSKLAESMNLPGNVVELSAYIYRKALEKGLIRGRSIKHMADASIYAACRETKMPKTLKDVSIAAEGSLEPKKKIAMSYRILHREGIFEITPASFSSPEPEQKEAALFIQPPDLKRNLARIANEAQLSEKTKRSALELLENPKVKEISVGKSPMGFAGGVLYMATLLEGESKTQKGIADAAGVTEVTIRNRYKDLKAVLKAMPEVAQKPALPDQSRTADLSDKDTLNTLFKHDEMRNKLFRDAKDIEASEDIADKAVEIYNRSIDKGINEYPDKNFAMACLVSAYRISGEDVDWKNFENMGVSRVKVNRKANEIMKKLKLTSSG